MLVIHAKNLITGRWNHGILRGFISLIAGGLATSVPILAHAGPLNPQPVQCQIWQVGRVNTPTFSGAATARMDGSVEGFWRQTSRVFPTRGSWVTDESFTLNSSIQSSRPVQFTYQGTMWICLKPASCYPADPRGIIECDTACSRNTDGKIHDVYSDGVYRIYCDDV
jgi:hypothetical protein